MARKVPKSVQKFHWRERRLTAFVSSSIRMFRIAPTPSGYLHLGNAFSFLLTRKLADRAGEKVFLRIDDLDGERKRPEYVEDIFLSLEWLGIPWDIGPKDPDDFERNWSQHLRLQEYRNAYERLLADKRLFACSCSRKRLSEYGSAYPETCQLSELPIGSPDTAVRIKVPRGTVVSFDDLAHGRHATDLSMTTGSFIVLRKDGLPAYQLASLVDDRLFGITSIVRGLDLISSTAVQLFLAEAIGYESFRRSVFLHHRLLQDDGGNKLSKSEGALSLKAMREAGVRSEEVFERLDPLLDEYLR